MKNMSSSRTEWRVVNVRPGLGPKLNANWSIPDPDFEKLVRQRPVGIGWKYEVLIDTPLFFVRHGLADGLLQIFFRWD